MLTPSIYPLEFVKTQEKYARAFLAQRTRLPTYRFDNIEALLDLIVSTATNMRE